jgi:predicted  nucleic acid-binding Zn-ribbon protein
MPYRCETCGNTQEDKAQTCGRPDCGFRSGRFVQLAQTRQARGGCVILAILGFMIVIVVSVPSLNQGVVALLSQAIDNVIRWGFRH